MHNVLNLKVSTIFDCIINLNFFWQDLYKLSLSSICLILFSYGNQLSICFMRIRVRRKFVTCAAIYVQFEQFVSQTRQTDRVCIVCPQLVGQTDRVCIVLSPRRGRLYKLWPSDPPKLYKVDVVSGRLGTLYSFVPTAGANYTNSGRLTPPNYTKQMWYFKNLVF